MNLNTSGAEWNHLASDPMLRRRAIREYSEYVLGDHASRWLGRSSFAVRRGTCSIASACESADGFFEAMAELARISEFERRERAKRERLREERDAA